jgi:hypothetical protein
VIGHKCVYIKLARGWSPEAACLFVRHVRPLDCARVVRLRTCEPLPASALLTRFRTNNAVSLKVKRTCQTVRSMDLCSAGGCRSAVVAALVLALT